MNDQMKFIKDDLKYLDQMKNITSFYLFQFYVRIFFKYDIINLNNNTRHILKQNLRY